MALSAMSVLVHVCLFVMFLGSLFFPPFCMELLTGGSLVLMFGAVVPCGLGKGTDSLSACPRALLVWV